MRKVKIICTIGPASASPEMLEHLISAGMNVARLNFSHGTREFHTRAIAVIREAAARRSAAVAILQDLQGPRLRVGTVPPEGVELIAGQRVRLWTGQLRNGAQFNARVQASGEDAEVPVAYPHLARDVKAGARILIDDGLIELVVSRIADGEVHCSVLTGGVVMSNKGLNLPGTVVSAPTLTDKDREDLQFGLAQGVDYVALSFVRGAEDIEAAREVITACGGDVPVIAKIERAEAVDALEAILDAADGVMIARGDLGVELGPEGVPVVQKRIIEEANCTGKLVITATQMLESMTHNPRPTRAEASDVANAIFDGTDAVMLSGETSVGRYPVEAVQVMDRIILAAEQGSEPGMVRLPRQDKRRAPFPAAVCKAAASAASAIEAQAIVAFTEAGATARLMSKHRPAAPIIGLSPFEPVRRRMALYWGVVPHVMSAFDETDARIAEAERRVKEEGLAQAGDRIVILSGSQIGVKGGTNLMKLHEVS